MSRREWSREALERENEALRQKVSELERRLGGFDASPDLQMGESLAERVALIAEVERIAGMGSWVFDPIDNKLHWSDQLFRIFGYEPGEIVPTLESHFACMHPDDVERMKEASRRGIETGVSEQHDFRVVWRDGQVRHVTINSALIFDDSGTLRRAVGAVLDRTDRDRLEERLRQTHKMEALGRLAAGIVHDFNNLLQVVAGSTELLAEELSSDEVETIMDATRAGSDLLGQLLAFGRPSVPELAELDVNAELMSMKKLIQQALGPSAECELKLGEGLPNVILDRSQFQQIVMNVAVNARDAMPEGGKFSIETRRVDSRIELLLSDSGIGMSESQMSRVFEPFFTTKEEGAGSGLGLSTVFNAVRQNGGTVEIDSQLGEGTTVRVRFLTPSDGRPSPSLPTAEANTSRPPSAQP